jgi:hypothetical protein
MEEWRDAYRVLMAKHEGKRQLAGSSRRWEDNIERDFKEIGWETWTGWVFCRCL